MLATLHVALLLGIASAWTRPLLLAHLGVFLLWQPLWRGESRLSLNNTLFIGLSSLLALIWLNWWVLAFWVSGLFSLVGSRVFTIHTRWQRWRYLLAMVYLLSVLLFWVTPHLFGLPVVVDATASLMYFLLPLLLIIISVIPSETEKAMTTQFVDFIYSLLLFLLLTLLVLSSLAFMHLSTVDYFDALLRSLFIIALMLFALSWLWNPRLGFAGFQAIFSRYLLNIGTPLEIWLKHLAETSQQEPSPAVFLNRAIEHFAELPWVSGLSWISNVGHGNLGSASQHRIEVIDHDLHLTLFSRQPISPLAVLHINLLAQLLGHFYQSKRREQRLQEFARLQAIYETGSRLTHDLKNMLQSLFTLTSVAQHQPEKAQPILQRQLPVLTQRIELILAKLKSPDVEPDSTSLPLSTWWEILRLRHQHAGIEWIAIPDDLDSQSIPSALFDCVADNLIDNACNKRTREPHIRVSVTLDAQHLSLRVSDTGSPISLAVANQLLNNVVPSEDGLGVGLYQAARWASQAGFRLSLIKNEPNEVCFELKHA